MDNIVLSSHSRLSTPNADVSRVPRIEIKSLKIKCGWEWGVGICALRRPEVKRREESVVFPALPPNP